MRCRAIANWLDLTADRGAGSSGTRSVLSGLVGRCPLSGSTVSSSFLGAGLLGRLGRCSLLSFRLLSRLALLLGRLVFASLLSPLFGKLGLTLLLLLSCLFAGDAIPLGLFSLLLGESLLFRLFAGSLLLALALLLLFELLLACLTLALGLLLLFALLARRLFFALLLFLLALLPLGCLAGLLLGSLLLDELATLTLLFLLARTLAFFFFLLGLSLSRGASGLFLAFSLLAVGLLLLQPDESTICLTQPTHLFLSFFFCASLARFSSLAFFSSSSSSSSRRSCSSRCLATFSRYACRTRCSNILAAKIWNMRRPSSIRSASVKGSSLSSS